MLIPLIISNYNDGSDTRNDAVLSQAFAQTGKIDSSPNVDIIRQCQKRGKLPLIFHQSITKIVSEYFQMQVYSVSVVMIYVNFLHST
jgi:hypothetical protein